MTIAPTMGTSGAATEPATQALAAPMRAYFCGAPYQISTESLCGSLASQFLRLILMEVTYRVAHEAPEDEAQNVPRRA